MIGYSDSGLAGDCDDWKSTSGAFFFLGQSPVSWQSQKQRVVALSSCEAEYIAAATAACQGIWLLRLLTVLVTQESSRHCSTSTTCPHLYLPRTRCFTIGVSTLTFVSISFATASAPESLRRITSRLVISWRTCSRSRSRANVSRSYAFGVASSTLFQRNMIRGECVVHSNLLRACSVNSFSPPSLCKLSLPSPSPSHGSAAAGGARKTEFRTQVGP